MTQDVRWSKQATRSGDDWVVLSMPMVLCSNADHYIGQLCLTVDGEHQGLIEPCGRDTVYYPTHEEAEALLPGFLADRPDTDYFPIGVTPDLSMVNIPSDEPDPTPTDFTFTTAF